MSFLGEDKSTAERGVGRHDLGLDRCTPVQQRFRALLALHLLNTNAAEAPRRIYSASSLLLYDLTVSPRYDELLFIIPPATRNALGRLMAPLGFLESGMPGLRMVGAHDNVAYHILHLPTGARMTLAGGSDFPSPAEIRHRGPDAGRSPSMSDYPGPDVPLDPVESAALAAIPAMAPGIQVLLAALVSRLAACDPRRRWAMGQWWQDPLKRPTLAGYRYDESMYLWGSGTDWELRWCKHPRPTDVVACLTDPRAGVPGVTATECRNGWTLEVNGSKLSLHYGETR